ncbi:MAG: NtrZ family periplasmic regulatory protein [Caulobacterales bacterium]
MSAMAVPVKASEEAPWFQRFTFGSGYSNDLNGWSSGAVRNDSESMRVVTEGRRWGMSMAVRDKKDWAPLSQSGARDKVAAGAFYNMTPRFRFGGEMTLETRSSGRDSTVEPGVKLGSAFRF